MDNKWNDYFYLTKVHISQGNEKLGSAKIAFSGQGISKRTLDELPPLFAGFRDNFFFKH